MVRDLVVNDDRRQLAVDHVSFQLRAGEIVGVAGVEGNGQDELVEALAGLRSAREGRIELDGKDITRSTTHWRLMSGIAHIPADRHRMGVVMELPISDNLVLNSFDRKPFARGILRAFDAVSRYAEKLIKAFDIRLGNARQPLAALSGGNQQKVVAAREMGREPKVLIASQPTRGVDVGSIEFIHRRLLEQRDAGLAVLLVSSELDEVLSLADRVVVMYRGRTVADLSGDQIDRERIGLLMAGAA
jgi:simple sugar transport system ATP-binding protein